MPIHVFIHCVPKVNPFSVSSILTRSRSTEVDLSTSVRSTSLWLDLIDRQISKQLTIPRAVQQNTEYNRTIISVCRCAWTQLEDTCSFHMTYISYHFNDRNAASEKFNWQLAYHHVRFYKPSSFCRRHGTKRLGPTYKIVTTDDTKGVQ